MKIRKIRFTSFWKQLFVYFLIFIVIPLVTVYAISSFVYKNNITRNTIQYSENELEILEDNFTNYLKQFKTLSDNFFINSQFNNIAASEPQQETEYIRLYTTEMEETLKEMISSFDGVDTLIYIDNDNQAVSVGYPYYNELDTVFEMYRDKMDKADGKVIWGFLDDLKGKKLIVCRKISFIDSSYRTKKLGYIMMIVDERTLYEYYKNLKAINNSIFYVMDQEGTILSSNSRNDTGKNFSYKVQKDNGFNFVNNMENEKCYFISRSLSLNGWSLMYLIPERKINEEIYKVNMYIAIVGAICIIISVFISLYLSQRISNPLKKLSKSMMLVEKGDFSVQVDTPAVNEVGVLYKSFNMMVRELNRLFNKSVAMELRTKEAQIQSYQRQINPHFIYNTLEMIRMMAILNEYEKIDDAVISLSQVLRFNLKGEKEVKIENEIMNIQYYFTILKLRYGDNFDYLIKVPEEIYSFYTLKFLLQPLIENAVYHGLEKVERKGMVYLFAKKIKDEIIFIIRDNGIGIEPDRLEELKRSLNEERQDGGASIGLWNVHQRIQLQYGKRFGIDIKSKYNERTTIMIHIPAYTKEGNNNV